MQPTGNRRQIQKAETRELILDSARALFETEGYQRTTMRAVATHAGIGLGTIYKHFQNKPALLVAAFLGDLTRLYESAMSGIPAGKPLRAQFLHISRKFLAFHTGRPALSKAYLTNMFSLDADNLALINTFDEAYTEKLVSLAEQAQQRGEIDSAKDPNYIALSLAANYFYVLGNNFLRYNETDIKKLLDLLGHMLDQTLS